MNKNSNNNTTDHLPVSDYPSTLRITSKPFTSHSDATLDRIEAWEAGREVPHVVNFQDASRLQRILTPRRLDLIRSLMTAPASSIRDLADRLDRDVRQVHDDCQLLAEYRIITFHEVGGAKQPHVPYDTVTIEVELTKPSDDTSESTASA